MTSLAPFQRDIFRSGRYLEHFDPDAARNPFRRLYARKRADVVRILRELPNPRLILDIGGGWGRLWAGTETPSSSRIVLSDISSQMLARAKSAGPTASRFLFVQADAERLPFRAGSFDAVVGLDLVCHLADPAAAVAEFHRVLNGTGTLILDSTNNRPAWALFYPRYLGWNPFRWFKILAAGGVLPRWRGIVRHYSKKRFHAYLGRAGFDIVAERAYGPVVCPKWHLAVSRKGRVPSLP